MILLITIAFFTFIAGNMLGFLSYMIEVQCSRKFIPVSLGYRNVCLKYPALRAWAKFLLWIFISAFYAIGCWLACLIVFLIIKLAFKKNYKEDQNG